MVCATALGLTEGLVSGRRRFTVLERVIQILMFLANRPEGASIREIARSVGMNPYVCGRYIDNMERWGLVTRERKGRAYIVRITDRGLRAVVVATQLLSYIPLDIGLKAIGKSEK